MAQRLGCARIASGPVGRWLGPPWPALPTAQPTSHEFCTTPSALHWAGRRRISTRASWRQAPVLPHCTTRPLSSSSCNAAVFCLMAPPALQHELWAQPTAALLAR
ncbi:hypothetical protein ABPG77_007547 [Micractinium sp. CCAP 211/92]